MPRKEQNKREARNLILIEWTAAVYGIFWSVWWGFFVQQILDSEPGTAYVWFCDVPKGIVLSVSTILVCFYVFHFVRWMWGMHKLAPGTPARSWVASCKWVGLSIAPIIGAVIAATDLYGLSEAQKLYGISLTVGWPLLTGVQVWFSEEEVAGA